MNGAVDCRAIISGRGSSKRRLVFLKWAREGVSSEGSRFSYMLHLCMCVPGKGKI